MKPTVPQLRQLVGNPKAYALQREDGTYQPVRQPLTPGVLVKHRNGVHTVGTYVLKGNLARTLVFDVDTGKLEDADRIEHALRELGVPHQSIGVEESGGKGYHVWVLTREYVPAIQLRRIGLAVRDEVGMADLEVFPKQDEASDLGNLVKLPGGVHRKTGLENNFVTAFPVPLRGDEVADLAARCPEIRARSPRSGSQEEAFPCMAFIQEHGAPEGNRNRALFHLATMLRRHSVSSENVRNIIRATNLKNDPPLDAGEVDALLSSAETSGPICSQLPESMRCGDLCLSERTKGLWTRPGRLRHAQVGERVVMEVTERDDGLVTLEHPDVVQARGYLKEVGRGDD